MAEAVARAIRGKQHLVAEAGTGVGKSFAYLVPAILAATEPNRPRAKMGQVGESPPSKRDRCLDAHDQSAGTTDRQGPAAA